jgi:hypothetical protein
VVAISPAGRRQLQQRGDASIARIEAVLGELTATERTRLAAAVPLLEKVADRL